MLRGRIANICVARVGPAKIHDPQFQNKKFMFPISHLFSESFRRNSLPDCYTHLRQILLDYALGLGLDQQHRDPHLERQNGKFPIKFISQLLRN